MKPTLEEICLELERFWRAQGCLLWQPYPSEVGAGTFNPATFFKVLDRKPWRVCYLEPSRRPRDGRYGQNPFRVQQFWQFQVVLKPAPADAQGLYLRSLARLGVDPIGHDIRFVEDDWESPTLGAWGLGWQVELDGIEITQFTYFQQVGGLDLPIIPVELTYGLERIAMFLQGVDSIFDVRWDQKHTWGDLYRRNEEEFSRFNFELSDPGVQISQFDKLEAEAERLLKLGLLYPGYDCVVKCSHGFNLLEARGGISVSERTKYIARVRRLARMAAELYLNTRDEATPAD